LAKADAVVDMKVNLNLSNPEYQAVIDRPLASDLGVRVSDIASAVRLLMSGEMRSPLTRRVRSSTPVTMRLLPSQRDNPEALSRLLVPRPASA
jgi:HAE1 family hydrophobic/amphiphilic exporter-1